MKFLVLAAMAATAYAQQSQENSYWQDLQDANTDAAADIAKKVGILDTAQYVSNPSVDSVKNSLERVAAIASKVSGIDSGLNEFNNGLDGAIAARENDLKKHTAARHAALKQSIAAAVASLKAKLADRTQAIEDEYGEQVKSISTQSQAQLGTVNDAKKHMAATNECIKKGQVLTNGKCVAPTIKDGSNIGMVYQQGWTNNDGREGGYVSNREVTFTKKEDDTFIRIMYSDNMRLHGHTSHGRWNVMICDSGGGGCDHCKDPGPLQHWKYSSHQHNWWMNDHHHGTLMGICRKTGNRELKKGTYKLRIMIDSARYDLYTGHDGQYGNLMVDEVLRI